LSALKIYGISLKESEKEEIKLSLPGKELLEENDKKGDKKIQMINI
jgi:hypothetical protein